MRFVLLSTTLLALTLSALTASAQFESDGISLVTIPAGSLDYRSSGEFLEDGYPVDAPMEQVVFDKPFEIMSFQVTVAQYDQCVAAKRCQARLGDGRHQLHLPATGISYRDANDYAAWLSEQTGDLWRLPTDKEWAYAAAERFIDDALSIPKDVNNPSTRWLAKYQKYSDKATGFDPVVKDPGSYGANEFGVHDMSGNIWEWTDTCYTRKRMSAGGEEESNTDNCGVRIAAGQHRAYVTYFIQDAKGGGCSVGAPPDYLGFRLVREEPKSFWGSVSKRLGF